jgi:CubicO group peptidase (beta-lactamase class C family)
MGYMLLGRVIESATNQIYEDFVIQRVLKPYGIMDMHIGRSYLTQRRFNEVKYYDTDDSIKVQSFERTGRLVPKAYGGNPIELLGAAGGWITSSIELAKLMVLIDGFRNIPDMLPANLINQMIDDEPGRGPLGWKDVKDNGDWIRTGTMAGTTAIMKRQSNGFAWVVVLNSSSWKGPRLQAYINYMMGQIEKNVKKWPSLDLFKYQPKN